MVVDDTNARAALYRMTTSGSAARAKMGLARQIGTAISPMKPRSTHHRRALSPTILLIARHMFDAVAESM